MDTVAGDKGPRAGKTGTARPREPGGSRPRGPGPVLGAARTGSGPDDTGDDASRQDGSGHGSTGNGTGRGGTRRLGATRRRPWRTASALRLSHPADLAELRVIRGRVECWGRRNGVPPETLIDLQLAVGEAVSNGMEHAYVDGRGGPRPTVEVDLELRFTSAGRAVVACVTDHGRWRPAAAQPGYRGRGLALIEELSSELQVMRTADGTQLRIVIPLTR